MLKRPSRCVHLVQIKPQRKTQRRKVIIWSNAQGPELMGAAVSSGPTAGYQRWFPKTLGLSSVPLRNSKRSMFCCWGYVSCHRGWQHWTIRARRKCKDICCGGGTGRRRFAKVVSVAEKTGVSITKNDVSICHHLPSGGTGPKPLIAKFVRRETKHQHMKNKRNLQTPTSLSMMISPPFVLN